MNSDVLDDASARSRLDPSDMLGSVAALPDQCREAWAAAQKVEALGEEINKVIVLGMGGSAIAGDIWRMLLQRESKIPVFNVRQYDLPPFVDERTLVIASSYSGNTEETLSTFEQALATPAKKLAITSGGKLLTIARANGVPTFTYEFDGEPRAAIGWGLMPLLALSLRQGWMPEVQRDVGEAIQVMEGLRGEIGSDIPTDRNEAKMLAARLFEKLPVVYAGLPLTEVAHRWKSQLNESAKVWSFHDDLPELHHNAIVGFALPKQIAASTLVILLGSDDLVHRRVRMRYDFTRKQLAEAGCETADVESHGASALAQMMSLILFGDFVSTYLALLYKVDPTPTDVIEELRNWLATQS
ncbi:MAG: bifunctional phosphoglucose/phosphomannose isomerase [Dehalococcoidia bacterium]